MIVMKIDGSLIWNSIDAARSTNATGAVELPADLIAERSDLLDDLFTLAFDVLGLRKLDLRIRPYADSVAAHNRNA
ncbi:MAG TPA: hypothetical protein VFO07_20685 [Roseiflexaceae bacterium]|nr:hypothetical protein [Roseiflexaceae bacterium]